MRRWKEEKVRDIFSSGADWPEPHWDWNTRGTAFDETYLAWLESGRGSGGEKHGWLKWWAWNWLKQTGAASPCFESPYQCGRADLLAHDLRYIVECGDTPPERVLPALATGRWAAFVVFPYPYWRSELGRVDHSGWMFRKTGTAEPK